jgi:glycosyltransferase involved in cell wall biosynthesis
MIDAAPCVVHLVPALFGPAGVIGGAERYALELAKHMALRVPTQLVTFGRANDRYRVGPLDVRIVDHAWHVRGQPNNPLSFAIVAEILRADVVHCHQQHIMMSSVAALVGRVSGRRVFVTDLGGGGWDLSAYLSTDRWFHGHLHISEYSRKVFGHHGNPQARVILGGVDTDKFAPDSAAGRGKAAMFVGRLLPHKGIGDLIAALPADLSLDIVGPASDPAYLKRLEEQAGSKSIRFLHDCDDWRLMNMYQRALCVVLPSVYRLPNGAETRVPELLGQTLLEAMASGTPVICTNVASMPEIVEDGKTGFVVEPGDPAALGDRLRWLAGHPAEAEEMGAAGRQVVLERFRWSQVVDRCLDAYASC